MATLGTYQSGTYKSFIYGSGATVQGTSSMAVPSMNILSTSVTGDLLNLSVGGNVVLFTPEGDIL